MTALARKRLRRPLVVGWIRAERKAARRILHRARLRRATAFKLASDRRKTTSRGSGCREFVCYRGWSNRGLDDREPITGFTVCRIEAQGLAEKNRSGLVLIAPCRELAEQPVSDAALRIEPDDVAKVGLGVEITAQPDVGTCADKKEGNTVRFAIESVAHERDDARVMARFEQLARRCQDCWFHGRSFSKARATNRSAQVSEFL